MTDPVAAALIERWDGTQEGGDRVGFRCRDCGGHAVYSARTATWRCWSDGCGASGGADHLAKALAVRTPRPAGPSLGATGDVLPTSINAAELAVKAFPEPRWAVPGVVPEGATLFAGPPKKGKSWLMLGLGVAIAAGGAALGSIPVEAGDVLYLALEDNERRLQDRLLRVLDGEPAPARLHFYTRWPALGNGGAEALDAWLGAHPETRLVVIDVVARVRQPVNGSANLYQADYGTMAGIKAVADAHGVALVGVFHTRKADADDPLDTVSGTTGLAGAADTILVLTREKGRADATLYVRGRDVPEADHALAFDPVTCRWSLLGDAAEYRLTEERAAIVAAIRDAGEELSPKQIAEALGKKDGAVRFLIRKMAKDGEVVGVAGRYTLPANSANSANSANPANSGDSTPGEARVSGVSGGGQAANSRLRLVEAETAPELAASPELAGSDRWTR